MTPSSRPVTRESSALVRDRGARPVIVTITGSILLLRPKGLRSEETLDIAAAWDHAVKQRLARQRAEKAAKKKARAGALKVGRGRR